MTSVTHNTAGIAESMTSVTHNNTGIAESMTSVTHNNTGIAESMTSVTHNCCYEQKDVVEEAIDGCIKYCTCIHLNFKCLGSENR